MYALSKRSIQRLKGVHPSLVEVVNEAIKNTTMDFSVIDGVRTLARQKEYVAKGVSQTMNSKHLVQEDGYGHAVDVAPYVRGGVRWERQLFYPIAVAMVGAGRRLNVNMRWGGAWKLDLRFVTFDTPEHVERALMMYEEGRRRDGARIFFDAAHWELV